MLAIEELTQGAHAPGAVEAFMGAHTFPIVEGRQVTFVYRGQAQEVFLQHWIHALAQQQSLHRLQGTDLWYLTLELPRNSRIEYKLGLTQGGPMGMHGHGPRAQLIRDPLNPHHALDPFGANSVVHTEGYVVPEWTQPDADARPGEIRDHTIRSAAFGEDRPVQVYLPARYRSTRAYPLLVVHDGEDFLRFASLKTVLDNLIHRLEIPPIVCALTTSPNRMKRVLPTTSAHATIPSCEELLPMVEGRSTRSCSKIPARAVSSARASEPSPHCPRRGGIPGIFHRLCLLSGSFLFTDIGDHEGGPAFDASSSS